MTITIPITADNLPTGNHWEADGACWRYELDPHSAKGFRLAPINGKAFAKIDGPAGPMTDFYLPAKIGGLGRFGK